MTRRFFVSAAASTAFSQMAAQPGSGDLVLENAVESAYDSDLRVDVMQAFHGVPWIDAASVRVRWLSLEPRPGEFNWIHIDQALAEVKKFNAAHSRTLRTLQVRPMGGEHCPRWFAQAGVRFYDTTHPAPDNPNKPLRAPMPYDNPVFIDRLRRVYRAMYERYKDEPLVALYHGTWSAGPWDEIFIPVRSAPRPPGYTPEKFAAGMREQLDVLLEEFSLKGKPAELPWSGVYESGSEFLRVLRDRIVERLGKRSPYLYLQSNGWGVYKGTGRHTIAWGHERDIDDLYGKVNLGLQAIGTNAGGNWIPNGDWVELIRLAEKYEAPYAELYPPDFMPIDTEHRMVDAFNQEPGGAIPGFIGFRPWLRRRDRVMYTREGIKRRSFRNGKRGRTLDEIRIVASVPADCVVTARARTRIADSTWSEWQNTVSARRLPPGQDLQVEVRLRTDDGFVSPRVIGIEPVWRNA